VEKKKLDVLLISAVYDPPSIGGVASHVKYLSKALSELQMFDGRGRFKCRVIVLTGQPHNDVGVPKRYLRIFRHLVSKDEPRPFSSPGAIPLMGPVQKILDDWQKVLPDVIHAHDFESAFIGMMLKSAHNVPLFVTVHKTPKEIDRSAARTQSKESFLKLLISTQQVDKFIAPGRAYSLRLQEQGIPARNIALVNNGVPITDLVSQSLDDAVQHRFGLSSDGDFILCPSRLDRHKGIETLIDAAALLQNDPDIKKMNLKFLVAAGSGDARYRAHLQRIVAGNGLDGTFLLGPSDGRDCNANEMKWLYRNAVACVLPSRREGFSQALLEAFVHQTPVLASNTGGNPEIVRPEKTGYLFDRDEPDKLARQLKELLRNSRQTKRMVEDARVAVEREYSAKGMASNLFDLYCEASGITIKAD